jgi:hypothetical protein
MGKNWQSYDREWTIDGVNVIAKSASHFDDLLLKVGQVNTFAVTPPSLQAN